MIRSRQLMGDQRNTVARDLVALVIIGIVTLLAAKTIYSILIE